MMERSDFHDRLFERPVPISVHEFLYPLMQGYDSVALKSDLELGGTDQKFQSAGAPPANRIWPEPQCILTVPLLEPGRRGQMSKSKTIHRYRTDPCSPKC
jgi:tyrosyl-tRNA synthetase